MPKTNSEYTNSILEFLYKYSQLLPRPIDSPHAWARRIRNWDPDRKYYRETLRRLAKRGVIEISEKANRKFVKITAKGELELLLHQAILPKHEEWDGKWRLMVYDIPEKSKNKRQLFRYLLKHNGFIKLQGSVYISPYSLNRAALQYLKSSGLIDYIRIMRVDDMDNDRDLKKRFKL